SRWAADKTFKVTPTTHNINGQYEITLYYTETEIAGWEATTGNSRTELTLFKTNGAVSNVTPMDPFANGYQNVYASPANNGSYGSNYFVRGQFNTGFSGFGIGRPGDFGPLPVVWSNFTAKRINSEQVILTWELYQAIGLQKFIVERSENGTDFYPIQTIPVTIQPELKWQTMDNHSFSIAWYRIRSIDDNGLEQYSEIREVRNGESSWLVYPTVFANHFYLDASNTLEETVSIRVYNVNGQIVFSTTQILSSKQLISWENFPSGVYYLEIQGKLQKTNHKLVKVE
ncbi:MAG: T9SS type A sorting domain-containing protein, partial [Bacteroidia bacterium]|nr:T9SS type A sorting domain-containing protein [Bacteroidia bacterium]